jgi:hypothetical protein
VGVFASFLQVFHSVKVRRGSEDKLWWVLSKRGLFKVKLFFNSFGYEGSRFPWKSMWWTQAPLRAAFFAWLATLDKILTLDNLRKWRVIAIDRCCMCKRDGEFVDHLLLHCDVASTLWSVLFSCFGMSWVMPRRVIDLFACWWYAGRPRSVVVWKMVPTCLFWTIWRERSNNSFEDLERFLEDIISYFFHTLYLWTATFVSPLMISYDDFLVCFSLSS